MGQPYSLKTSQRVSMRQFISTVLNYCQCGWIWLRRERYWPADMVEARIYMLEQNMRTVFTLWERRVYSYFWDIYYDQITFVDYWYILLQQLLKTFMNLLRKGMRHSSKAGSSASALQQMASNFNRTLTSSKLLMQFCQFCYKTTVCCITISLKSYLKSVSSLDVTSIIQFLVSCSGMELKMSIRNRILSLRSQNWKLFSAGELRMESMSWWMCCTFLTRRQTSPFWAQGLQMLREVVGWAARNLVMRRMQLLMQVDSTPNCSSSQTARYCSQRVTQFSKMRMRSLRIMYLMVYQSILETQAFISAILQLLISSISTLLFSTEGCRQFRCTCDSYSTKLSETTLHSTSQLLQLRRRKVKKWRMLDIWSDVAYGEWYICFSCSFRVSYGDCSEWQALNCSSVGCRNMQSSRNLSLFSSWGSLGGLGRWLASEVTAWLMRFLSFPSMGGRQVF